MNIAALNQSLRMQKKTNGHLEQSKEQIIFELEL